MIATAALDATARGADLAAERGHRAAVPTLTLVDGEAWAHTFLLGAFSMADWQTGVVLAVSTTIASGCVDSVVFTFDATAHHLRETGVESTGTLVAVHSFPDRPAMLTARPYLHVADGYVWNADEEWPAARASITHALGEVWRAAEGPYARMRARRARLGPTFDALHRPALVGALVALGNPVLYAGDLVR